MHDSGFAPSALSLRLKNSETEKLENSCSEENKIWPTHLLKGPIIVLEIERLANNGALSAHDHNQNWLSMAIRVVK